MKQNFVQGAFILVIAGLITRAFGTIYRIILSRFIGPEAIGLYQMAFPTLIMLITIVTAGLPIAVSKLVAEADARNNPGMAKKVLNISLAIVISVSLIISFAFYIIAPFLSKYFLTDERVYYTLIGIVPIIPIISISSVLRGYFQGKLNMIPTAVSTIVETIFRMGSGTYLSLYFLQYGVEYASFGAMIGMVIGEIAGFITLIFNFILHRKKEKMISREILLYDHKNIYQKISRIAIPVTTSQMFGSFAYFIEPSIVAHSLAVAGFSTGMTTSLYGQLAGMAMLIITFPTVITYSLSQSLVPAISEAHAVRNYGLIYKRLHQALLIAFIIGIPASILMYVLADPLAMLLFNTTNVGHLIKIISPFAIFLYIQRPLAATLQGLDRAKEAMTNSIIGSIAKIIAIMLLASRPSFGIDGVAIAINIGMLLVTVLNFSSISKIIGYTIKIKPILATSVSALIMGYISYYVIQHSLLSFPMGVRLLVAATVSGLAYIYLLLLLRVIEKEDFEKIPWLGTILTRLIP